MSFSSMDYVIMVSFLIIMFSISFYYQKFSSKNIKNYFLGGRDLSWWLAGTSMVATTFAADTPLAVTELIAKYGVAGNWLWWNMLAGGMLVTFFFASFWRKSGVSTDLEFIELRYSGVWAKRLRIFRAIYFGLVMNILIMSWVNLAMLSLLKVFFPQYGDYLIFLLFFSMILVTIYSTMAGLKGVVITDNIQFWLAMIGCIILAYTVLNLPEVGGVSGLKEKLPDYYFDFFPRFNAENSTNGLILSIGSFLTFITVQWWASWYPGAEPGGGGYIAQRMLSTKSEKDSMFSVMFFQMAHYGIRPWPWIIVALCSLCLYPELEDKKLGFVMTIKDYLPSGLKGLLFISFVSAYFSTISTQLNWGASYLVNDLYLPLTKKPGGQKQLTSISYLFCILLALCACGMSMVIESVSQVWSILIECGAGLGFFMIVRWFWWRVNAQTEIAATIIPLIMIILTKFILTRFDPKWESSILEDPTAYLLTVFTTVILSLIVMYFTSPVDDQHLKKFYRKVKPLGFWKRLQPEHRNQGVMIRLLGLFMAILLVYSFLFGLGSLILQKTDDLLLWGILFFISIILTMFSVKRIQGLT